MRLSIHSSDFGLSALGLSRVAAISLRRICSPSECKAVGTGLKKHINKDIHDWYIEYASKEVQQTLMCPPTRLQDLAER